jgi:hypothetical protein
MTSPQPAPPLPPPPQPAQAALELADAALAAAGAWAQPLDPARHSRAVSQLYSVLRDLGIATRGLAGWQPAEVPPGAASAEFTQHMTSGARWLLSARSSLDGVLAFEGLGQLPDPDEPGTALCHAARLAILAWRQPSGSSADRDSAIRRLITATGFLSAATVSLATYAPRNRAIALQAVGVSLAELTADLTAAIQETGSGATRQPGRHRAGSSTGHQPGGPE